MHKDILHLYQGKTYYDAIENEYNCCDEYDSSEPGRPLVDDDDLFWGGNDVVMNQADDDRILSAWIPSPDVEISDSWNNSVEAPNPLSPDNFIAEVHCILFFYFGYTPVIPVPTFPNPVLETETKSGGLCDSSGFPGRIISIQHLKSLPLPPSLSVYVPRGHLSLQMNGILAGTIINPFFFLHIWRQYAMLVRAFLCLICTVLWEKKKIDSQDSITCTPSVLIGLVIWWVWSGMLFAGEWHPISHIATVNHFDLISHL